MVNFRILHRVIGAKVNLPDFCLRSCINRKSQGLDFELKMIVAVLAVFLVSFVFLYEVSVSGLQVADGSGRDTGMPAMCTDSDGGVRPDVAGRVSVTDSRGRITVSNDACSGESVVEFSCSNNQAVSRSYACANGCRDGACSPSIKLTIKKPVRLSPEVVRAAQTVSEEQRVAAERRARCEAECQRGYNICKNGCRVMPFSEEVLDCSNACRRATNVCMSDC